MCRTARPPCVANGMSSLIRASCRVAELDLVHLRHRPVVGARERQAADLRRRRHVARHQAGRDREHVGVVVEAEAGHVARQQLGAVDVAAPSRSWMTLTYSARFSRCEATRPGFGARGRGPVERAFRARRRTRRAWPASGRGRPFGRHLPAAQLADDLLEHLGVARRRRPRSTPSSVRPAGLQPVVVAGDAVLIEDGARRRAAERWRPSAAGLALRRRRLEAWPLPRHAADEQRPHVRSSRQRCRCGPHRRHPSTSLAPS